MAKVCFLGGKRLEAPPPEGSYSAVVSVDISADELLCFFNYSLMMMAHLRDLKASASAVNSFSAHVAYKAFERVFEDSALMDKFEHFYSVAKGVYFDERK